MGVLAILAGKPKSGVMKEMDSEGKDDSQDPKDQDGEMLMEDFDNATTPGDRYKAFEALCKQCMME